jgi:L-rhamnose mutarotase
MQRMGKVIGIAPEHIAEYKKLHAEVWDKVVARLQSSNITNYSIFLREPENLMFSYWEYVGDNFSADSAAIAADPVTRDWWADMEEVFHLD